MGIPPNLFYISEIFDFKMYLVIEESTFERNAFLTRFLRYISFCSGLYSVIRFSKVRRARAIPPFPFHILPLW